MAYGELSSLTGSTTRVGKNPRTREDADGKAQLGRQRGNWKESMRSSDVDLGGIMYDNVVAGWSTNWKQSTALHS